MVRTWRICTFPPPPPPPPAGPEGRGEGEGEEDEGDDEAVAELYMARIAATVASTTVADGGGSGGSADMPSRAAGAPEGELADSTGEQSMGVGSGDEDMEEMGDEPSSGREAGLGGDEAAAAAAAAAAATLLLSSSSPQPPANLSKMSRKWKGSMA
jgi:hypothetical protein